MKASQYNLLFEKEGHKIAFNSYSCALAVVNDTFIKILECLNTNNHSDKYFLLEENKELIEKMKQGNFIVEDSCNELALLKHRSSMGKYSGDTLSLTIAPTLDCNFSCQYCYETRTDSVMSEMTKKALLEFIKEKSRTMRNVRVTWFGGEPLLVKDTIFELSKEIMAICEEHQCTYNAFMVTNGYLLTEKVVDQIKECKIAGVQVTLDGLPEVHNLRRPLRSGGESFDRIIGNIVTANSRGLFTGIRINIDKTNSADLDRLLEILREKEITNTKVTLGKVIAYTEVCKSIEGICLERDEFAEINLDFQRLLDEKNFNQEMNFYYPRPKANYCCADHLNSYVIDVNGYMYKCWNDIGNKAKSTGHLTMETSKDMLYNGIDYMTWSPFEFNACKECNLLPVCMGGCPYSGKLNRKPDCERWKENIDNVLAYVYKKKAKSRNLGAK